MSPKTAAVPAIFALILAFASPVRAFCRTHGCNPADAGQHCQRDSHQCITTGPVLFWPSTCVGFSVQASGSPKYGLTATDLGTMVQTALDRWTNAACFASNATQDSVPSLHVENLGPVACDVVEFNATGANANVWMFRDDAWPYDGGEDALGLTTVHYDPDTGVIQDVDVEINGAASDPLTTDGSANGADLDSILTHEAGHFLGLSHTLATGATMTAGYEKGDISRRSLEPDDMAGICAAYPTGRIIETTDCSPRRGLAQECGGALPTPTSGKSASCALAVSAQSPALSWVACALLLGLAAHRRRYPRAPR